MLYVATVIGEMEKIADKIDDKDATNEGSSALSEAYKKLARPYMRDCHFIFNIIPVYYESINVQTFSRS